MAFFQSLAWVIFIRVRRGFPLRFIVRTSVTFTL